MKYFPGLILGSISLQLYNRQASNCALKIRDSASPMTCGLLVVTLISIQSNFTGILLDLLSLVIIVTHFYSYDFGIFLIRIKGSSGVEVLSGLHWYLKYWCGAHISWDKTGGTQLSTVPKPGYLPRLKSSGVLIQRPVPWSYYQNAVTSSCKSLCFLSFYLHGRK